MSSTQKGSERMAAQKRKEWLAGAVVAGLLATSVTVHYWVLRRLEAAHCVGYWDPRPPTEDAWPNYCYWMGAHPLEHAGVAGALFFSALVAGTLALLAIRPRWQKPRGKIEWRKAVIYAGIVVLLLWVWRHYFTATTF